MIISPVSDGFQVTQGFGENHDFYYKKFNMQGHNGQDIAVPQGTEIYAPIDGVAWLWNDPK